jgi:hypothetical protein
MISTAALATLVVLLSPSTAAATGSCQVSGELTNGEKMRCLAASEAMLDQPTLTLEQLEKGPGFDPADPDGSRHVYFTRDDTLTCYFRPYFAFISDKGQSPKFLCWLLSPQRAFVDREGRPIDAGQVRVVRKGHGTALVARSDGADAREIAADQVKINYLLPPYPHHSSRDNEVFTQVAATRLLWALGFPADYQYSALAVNCVGCSADPFKDNQKENTATPRDRAVAFRISAVERLFPGDALEVGSDDTWSWSDAAQLYGGSSWSRDQKVGYDAYRLALGMLAYHNALASQNRLVCAEWKNEGAGPKVCTRVVMMVQDVGSTFGKPGSFGNSRGDFNDWESQRVFADASRCELRFPLRGDATVLEDARALVARRLESLDRERVKAIFRAARFDMMDLKQLSGLRHGGSDPGQAALDQWTDAFLQRAAEIRNARNCRR